MASWSWSGARRHPEDAPSRIAAAPGPAPDPAAGLRFPPGVWHPWSSVLVVALVVSPTIFALWLAPDLRSLSGAATATEFVVYPVALGAAALIYLQWRVTGTNVLAWGTLCLSMTAVQGVMLAGLRAGDPGPFFARPGWILVVDLPVGLLALIALRRSAVTDLPLDPLGAGLLAGLLLSGINMVVTSFAPRLSMTSPGAVLVEIAFVSIGVAIGRTVYQLSGLPRWFAVRAAFGVLGLIANRLAICQRDLAVFHVVAIVTGVVGVVLLTTAAAAGLRNAMMEQDTAIEALSDRVVAMEAGERDSRAKLHELTNSISSIAVASTLLHRADEVPESQRLKLEQMIEAEAGRLARILTSAGGVLAAGSPDPRPGGGSTPTEPFDLDEVLEPVVISHQALRQRVSWEPSGLAAVGDPDAVAEAVNILLDNAARHAPEAETHVEVIHLGDRVEIAVRDNGPGLPEEVRGKLFEWGGRGPGSHGQGIGLHLAHKLMSNAGHSLRLEADRAGTSFVIGLPAAERGAS